MPGKTGILTDLERDRLMDYDNINDVVEKKNLNFRIKRKLSIIKSTLEDINLMLTALPKENTSDYIDNDTILLSLKNSEIILKIYDPFPIQKGTLPENLTAGRYNLIMFPDGRNGYADFSYKPPVEEERLYNAVQDHIKELQKIYDIDASLDLKLYSFDEYKEKMRPKIDSLLLNGIKYECFTNTDTLPGGVPPARMVELGHGGIDMRLPFEEQEAQRRENKRRAQQTREKEMKNK